jgi:hypothetical protein
MSFARPHFVPQHTIPSHRLKPTKQSFGNHELTHEQKAYSESLRTYQKLPFQKWFERLPNASSSTQNSGPLFGSRSSRSRSSIDNPIDMQHIGHYSTPSRNDSVSSDDIFVSDALEPGDPSNEERVRQQKMAWWLQRQVSSKPTPRL